jgi:1-acyl-sn-glycerol-3-phosphate acyltransferase
VPASAVSSTVVAPRPLFPTGWARSPEVSAVRDAVQSFGLVPLMRRELRPTVNGLDVLTRLRELGDGPVIFVANHASHLDTALVLTSLPRAWRRRTAVAAAADYFFDTWWRATGSALVFGTFPIERRSGTLSSTPAELLGQGWSIVIYPEGTRSPDGWTQRFHLGAAFLSVSAGVPVVPVGIRGSFAAMPRGRSWPVRGRPAVTVRFGDPLWPQDGEGVRELGPRIERAVAQLLDEDSSHWYGAALRAAEGTTPSTSAPVGEPVSTWRRVWERTEAPAVRRSRRVWGG